MSDLLIQNYSFESYVKDKEMLRKKKILQYIDKAGCGLEIGPSHNPIAPKKNGYNVHIIDHLSREDLKLKYKEDNSVNLDNIEEVDFVWKGESYADLTGKQKYYDWIIASHVIEHTPDLIGFLQDCSTILKDDGVISLVVPDKRYCFDHFRPISGISKVLDHHIQKNKYPSPGTVLEGYLNAVSMSGNIAWNAKETGDYKFIFSLEDTLNSMKSVQEDKAYVDVHSWCFVPHSFRLLIHDLFSIGLIPFQEMAFSPTDGCEFYLTLSRHGEGINKSRLEMLNIIDEEIKDLPIKLKQTESGADVPEPFLASLKNFIRRVRGRLT
ncbi:MAG: class I SAM-dependent methyltransferase [Desulfobacterales bacterium]|nr:class I SAM-dependent methyltransferase [Desulfobacterales bacterium]